MTHTASQQKGRHLIAELKKSPPDCDTTLCLQLINDGAALNAQDRDGDTALIRAVEYRYTDIVQVLLDKGAAMNTQDKYSFTALIWAAECGHTDIVRILIDKGADAGLKTDNGKTAWDTATERGHHHIAKTIRDHQIRKTFTAAAAAGTAKPRKIRRQRKRGAQPPSNS